MSSKYHIELHYDVKQNGLSIYRTDSFFTTPTCEVKHDFINAENEAVIKYLSRFMRKPKSKGYIYVQEIAKGEYDPKIGTEKSKFVPVKMYNIENGAVMRRFWLQKYNEYSSGDAMSPDNTIKDLLETTEIWR